VRLVTGSMTSLFLSDVVLRIDLFDILVLRRYVFLVVLRVMVRRVRFEPRLGRLA